MKAQDFLKARGISYIPAKNMSVGRLAIVAEFSFSRKRGVIVSPKRGSISDRYLSLLFTKGVSFVVAESGSMLTFYESSQKTNMLHPVRSLKPSDAKYFPSKDLFQYLSVLLRQCVKKRESIITILSNLLVIRNSDEEAGNENIWGCSIDGTIEECKVLVSLIKGKLKDVDVNVESILQLCAIISGFRLKPATPEESAQLTDWVARASEDKKFMHGLPLALSPVFQSMGENADSIAIVTSAVGAQFSILSGSGNGEVVLENGNQELLSLLQVLYPKTSFIDGDYLESKPAKKKDAVVLIPPFGRSIQLKKDAELTSPFFKGNPGSKKYPAEYLYLIKVIDQCKLDGLIAVVLPEGILSGASHKAFRDWLLDAVQILGVVSLPSGFCISGTGIRCSILFMKKAKQLPADYSISMTELQQEDFDSDIIATTIKTIKEAFNPEVHA